MFDHSPFSHSPEEYVLSAFSVLGPGQGRGTEVPGDQSQAGARFTCQAVSTYKLGGPAGPTFRQK